MKAIIITGLLFLISFLNASAQLKYQKTIGDAGYDFGMDCKATSDGGTIITGYVATPGASRALMFLVKLDQNGDTMWMKTYDNNDDSGGLSVSETSDGGFIVTGFATPSEAIILWKTNSAGALQWTKAYAHGPSSQGECVMETSDHGYFVCGFEGSSINLVKTNNAGDTLWTKIISPNGPCRPYSLCETANGEYAVAGYTSTSSNGIDFFLLTIDATGNPLAFSTYGDSGDEQCFSLIQTNDNGFLLTGISVFGSAGANDDALLIKTDQSGSVEWANFYGDALDDIAYDAHQASDSGYIVAGVTNSYGAGGDDGYLFRTDKTGNVIWSKAYGDMGDDQFRAVQIMPDGGYQMVGAFFDISFANSNIYFVKADSGGNSGCHESNSPTNSTPFIVTTTHPVYTIGSGMTISTPAFFESNSYPLSTICTSIGIDESDLQSELIVYPNPSTGEFAVETKGGFGNLSVFDQPGREIYFRKVESDHIILDLKDFASGVYILVFRQDEKMIYQKLIIE